ncbi:uncharacterized protein LOC119675697 [Teleopsis dalmanni]|uniref:uncharacterized protein LOC119675697 n=1 Tax=Teleopsis dalmanni TaxID=139649 RepID=UPI0018CF2E53|nr:uncharacterized protein LOC119675697 [Teleopsis dalmanni]
MKLNNNSSQSLGNDQPTNSMQSLKINELEDSIKHLTEKIKSLEKGCESLLRENEKLKAEKNIPIPVKKKTSTSATIINAVHKKVASNSNSPQNGKRGRSSPVNAQRKNKQKKLDSYWLATPNRFEVLDNPDADNQEETSEHAELIKESKIPKPPPIFVAGVGNIQPLRALLNDVAPNEFVLKIVGHEVVNISNIRHRVTKKPLPLFFVGLKPSDKVKTIYNCTDLLHTKISIEAPKKKRELPQCTRCQRYGHTKHFCNHMPRCVKCPENHLSSDCPRKSPGNDVWCVLCEGNHPANYKGCTVYKQLQKKAFPALRRKITTDTERQQNTKLNVTSQTYANVVKSNNINTQEHVNSAQQNDFPELKSMLKTVMEQMSSMLNLLTAFVANTSK